MAKRTLEQRKIAREAAAANQTTIDEEKAGEAQEDALPPNNDKEAIDPDNEDSRPKPTEPTEETTPKQSMVSFQDTTNGEGEEKKKSLAKRFAAATVDQGK